MKRKALLFIALAWIVAAAYSSDQRVVAIGDVHGAFDDFVAILQTAAVIDEQRSWAGRNTTLIQTGDILDRGSRGRATMDLLMLLEQQAPKARGRVLFLLGNHETMNLIGDLRYVPPEEYANYIDAASEKRREAAYQAFLEFRKRRAKAWKQPETTSSEELKSQWRESHPPGFLEQREAFSPKGKYGKWLRGRDAIAEIDGTVFLHGGISPVISHLTVKQLNQRVKDEIKLFDTYKARLVQKNVILPFFTFEEMTTAVKEDLQFRQESGNQDAKLLQDFLSIKGWLIMNKDGPLWFRGYAEWSDDEGGPQVEALVKTYGIKHLVVGHTVQQDGWIRTRFHNGVLLIDTGMLRSYAPNGQASALEVQKGIFTGIYKNKRVGLILP